MPKLKTKSSVKKRFKVTGSGKIIRAHAGKRHGMIKRTPKQMAPYLMLRHHTISGSVEGLREAALLGKAWGLTADLVVRATTNTAMYFTNFEGLYAVQDALDELLDNWDS